MKVYFGGGLRETAKQAGYSNGVLNSIGIHVENSTELMNSFLKYGSHY